ncbi:MAG: hypothetical protein WCA24_01705 [Thiomonas sp.]
MKAYLRRILEQAVFERDGTPPEQQRAQREQRDRQLSEVPLPLTTTPAAFRERHRVSTAGRTRRCLTRS